MNLTMWRLFLLLLGILFSLPLFGQLQTTNWFFGDSAGITFSSDGAFPLNTSNIAPSESCASISDNQGNLLFYSNGEQIWNRHHQLMSGGENIKGSLSARQGVIIIPRPYHDSLYYVFTVNSQYEYSFSAPPEPGKNQLYYSRINIRQDNGLGAVTESNKLLYGLTTEKLAATQHANGHDYWLISHTWGNNTFRVYPVTSQGVGNPVVSATGPDYPIDKELPVGSAKVSPDGQWLAITKSYIELYRFSPENGQISHSQTLTPEINFSGIAIGPQSEKLYISSQDSLFQYNLSLVPDKQSFKQSKTLVYANPDAVNFDFGALQLAPNGKIYHVRHPVENNEPPTAAWPWLSAINKPALSASNCNYQAKALHLSPGGAVFGLPAFSSHYFNKPVFKATSTCLGDTTHISFLQELTADSLRWIFPDGSGKRLQAPANTAHYLFARADTFTISAVIFSNGTPDTVTQDIIVRPAPSIELGADTLVCGKQNIELNAFPENSAETGYGLLGSHTYNWHNRPDTTAKLLIGRSGAYSVTVTNYFGCQSSDTMRFTQRPLPFFNLGEDTLVCHPDTVLLSPNTAPGSYTWQNGSSQARLEVTQPGTYWLRVTDTLGCPFADTVAIAYIHAPLADFPDDTTICSDASIQLRVKHHENASVKWHDGSSDHEYTAKAPGTYSVTASNKCGTTQDSIRVFHKYCGPVDVPNVFTPNKDGTNDYFFIQGIDDIEARLTVFNRWGRKVFVAEDYQNKWRAENLPQGAYFYVLELPASGRRLKGFLQILR